MNNNDSAVNALLNGAYDLHMHAAPSPFNRAMNDIELLRAAGRAGMAGIVLKSHYESTAARAMIANEAGASSAIAYGAIALNWPVGGLNPYAVHNALKRNAKIVFMPTRDAENSLCSGDMPGDFFKRPGIRVLKADGTLKNEVYAIMDAVKQYDATLATGHISPEESKVLCEEGVKRGVRMVLTHPEFSRTKIDAAEQKKFADMGVLVEKCWYNIGEGECTAQEMIANIKTVGAEHCFLCTDRGQKERELPVDAMKTFVATLLNGGISEQDIFTMTHTVPKVVLGEL